MKLLLDTHALIWTVHDEPEITPHLQSQFLDSRNELFVSMATAWEISIKLSIGKLRLTMPFAEWMSKAQQSLRYTMLGVTIQHCDEQSRLPLIHRDPFDRMLAAQAMAEHLTLVSRDDIFDRYGIERVW